MKIWPGKQFQGLGGKETKINDLQSFLPLQKVGRKTAAMCEAIGDEFAEYFSAEGSVTWQNKYAIQLIIKNVGTYCFMIIINK
jgi:hypothetical protein